MRLHPTRISERRCATIPTPHFREIVAAYEAEGGGKVSDLERDIIRQAAALTYRGEELIVAILRGDRDAIRIEIMCPRSPARKRYNSVCDGIGLLGD
jgi:hypothetical protein